jgi:hypothetical protein
MLSIPLDVLARQAWDFIQIMEHDGGYNIALPVTLC